MRVLRVVEPLPGVPLLVVPLPEEPLPGGFPQIEAADNKCCTGVAWGIRIAACCRLDIGRRTVGRDRSIHTAPSERLRK